MQRITTGILLAFAAAFLFGCGGSSAPTPGTGDTGGNTGNKNVITVASPDSHTGDHSVSILPGQVNVVTGATKQQFKAIADKYGYSVLSYKQGHATVSVPAGGENAAISTLVKEYNVISADPVHVIHTPLTGYRSPALKNTSYYPTDPFYDDSSAALGTDGTNFGLFNEFAQGQPMNFQGFPTAWDVALSPSVANVQVKIAIIDAGRSTIRRTRAVTSMQHCSTLSTPVPWMAPVSSPRAWPRPPGTSMTMATTRRATSLTAM